MLKARKPLWFSCFIFFRMAGFRNVVMQRIGNLSGMLPTRFLQKISGQKLILPFYHAVSDGEMPHVRHLYPVKNVKAFTSDLDFLLKHYQPIDYHQFSALSSSGSKPSKPSFLLSFDDGLGEFHDVIAPILLKKGIPAICFLNSNFVDNHQLFYRYKASLLIDHVLKNPGIAEKISPLFSGNQNAVQSLLKVNYQQKHLLDEAADLVGFSFKEFLTNTKPYLSVNQIKTLKDQGFHFGGHSIDHPEYQYISIDEQIRQTVESTHFVCNTFNLDYRIFAFPFTDYGVKKEFFHSLISKNLIDYTFGGAGQKCDTAPCNFQRVPFEVGRLTGRQIHNVELLYFLVKALFGKNLIHRND